MPSAKEWGRSLTEAEARASSAVLPSQCVPCVAPFAPGNVPNKVSKVLFSFTRNTTCLIFDRASLTVALSVVFATKTTDSATVKLARSKIKHVVFLVKENRTFDTLFGTFPGANGATQGTLCDGTTVQLARA